MVPVSRGVAYSILAGLTAALVVVGCSRDLAVPTTVGGFGTPTMTRTATSTLTVTSTKTATATPTSTNTGLPSATATASNTATSSPTATDTPTQTNTLPPGSTNTDTSTPTFSATATSTSTSTATVTPTPTVASCSAASVQNSNFDSSLGCWAIDSGSTAVVTGYDISGTQTHTGAGALRIGVSEPSSSPAPVQINLNYSPAANLTGATITAWVLVDNASLIGGSTGAALFTQSGSPTWHYANGGFPSITTANTWVQVTWTPTFSLAGEDSTQVDQIGLQIYNIPANGVGNIYIDDITITYANTPTVTVTPTVTNTVGGFTSTPTTTPTVTSTPTTGGACTLLLNGCETLTDNGNWKSPSGDTLSISSSHATQGSNSLDCNTTTGAGWNQIAILNNFFPNDFSTATQIIMDVYADSSLITGNGGYDQMVLQANGGGSFATNSPAIVAGQQSITFTIPTGQTTVNELDLIYQSGGTPTGNLYIDNIRVVYSGACPTVPPTIQGWTFENNSITDSVGTWALIGGGDMATNLVISSPGQGSSYCADTTANFTAANQTAGIIMVPGSPIDGSTFTGIRASVWVDASCAPGQYPAALVQLGDGTNYPLSPWMNANLNGWATVYFPASSWGTFTASNITMIKVYTNLGGAAAFGTGHVKFDNIEFY